MHISSYRIDTVRIDSNFLTHNLSIVDISIEQSPKKLMSVLERLIVAIVNNQLPLFNLRNGICALTYVIEILVLSAVSVYERSMQLVSWAVVCVCVCVCVGGGCGGGGGSYVSTSSVHFQFRVIMN